MSAVWLFNLDADEELAAPAGYRAAARVLRGIEERRALLEPFLREGEAMAPLRGPAPELAGRAARPWCPTPSALRRCEELGLIVDGDPPPLPVLREVNGRRFLARWAASERGGGGRCAVPASTSLTPEGRAAPREILEASLASLGREGARLRAGPWVLKREHGFSGRGLRVIPSPFARVRTGSGSASSPGADRASDWAQALGLDESEAGWLRRSLALGPVVLEPWLERRGELVIHGWIPPPGAGAIRWASPLVQRCDARGTWIETRAPRAGELPETTSRALLDSAASLAQAMEEAGYHGPFGVDAFIGPSASEVMLCDLNARFTMSWWRSRDLLPG